MAAHGLINFEEHVVVVNEVRKVELSKSRRNLIKKLLVKGDKFLLDTVTVQVLIYESDCLAWSHIRQTVCCHIEDLGAILKLKQPFNGNSAVRSDLCLSCGLEDRKEFSVADFCPLRKHLQSLHCSRKEV